jgi:hypothetical protein
MRHRGRDTLTWIFARLVPKDEREPLLGDLAEEYLLRSNAASPAAALRWYLQQVCASAVSLLWARLTRAAWLSTLGVALLALAAVGIAGFIVNWAVYSSPETRTDAYRPLGMLLTFPVVVLIGYCAARFRRNATITLAALMPLSVTLMMLSADEIMPLWYRIAYFFVGPAAIFIGGAVCSLRWARSRLN